MKNRQEFINNLDRVLKLHYKNPGFDINAMADSMGISDRQLQRDVRALTGKSPIQYLRFYRLERSLGQLRKGISVGQAAKAVGFSSHTYFTTCFKAQFGVTPHRIQAN